MGYFAAFLRWYMDEIAFGSKRGALVAMVVGAGIGVLAALVLRMLNDDVLLLNASIVLALLAMLIAAPIDAKLGYHRDYDPKARRIIEIRRRKPKG